MSYDSQTIQTESTQGKALRLTFRDFATINRNRSESPQGFNMNLSKWTASDWFTALMGELGEAANIAKKLNRFRDDIPGNDGLEQAMLREELRKELADTFIYLDLLAQSEGINLAEAVIDKFNATSDKIRAPHRL